MSMDSIVIPSAPIAPGLRLLQGRPRAPLPVAAAACSKPPATDLREIAPTPPAPKPEQQIADAIELAVLEARREMQADMERQRDEAFEEARTRGHEAGLESGRAEGLRGVATADGERLAKLDATLAALGTAHAQWQAMLEEGAVEIGFAAACRILGSELLTPNGVRAHVRTLMAESSTTASAVVRLHPEDSERLRALGQPAAAEVQLLDDDGIAIGDCRIETPAGTLESRLGLRLGALRDALLIVHHGDRGAS